MYQVSKEYKDYLKTNFLNSSWQSCAELGAVNQQAQESAAIRLDNDTAVYASQDIFDDIITDPYATYEYNRTRADGTFKFISNRPLPSGIVSSQISDASGYINTTIKICSSAQYPLSVKGITLVFAKDVYACDFTIADKNGRILLSVTDNNQQTYMNEFVYNFDTVLYLHITKILKPYYRFRLSNVKLGLLLRFSSDKIMSMSYKEQLQLISTELYTADLSVTIDNHNGEYDIENPTSEIHFLEQAQCMKASLSLPLPSGNMEKIPLGTLFLADWSANLSAASFTARDRFSFMCGQYDKDKFHPEGISLYDLAVQVLTDAGIPSDEYLLDVYLKSVTVRNPLPKVTHKEALQLIANAGRCILKQNRSGQIVIKSSFVPNTTMSSTNKTAYADMELSGKEKDTYATYELDVVRADGKTYFLPGDRTTGYVSAAVSGSNCCYETHPYIRIDFEAPTNLFAFNLFFGKTIASDFIITTYLDDVVAETLSFTDNAQQTFYLDYPFRECNKIVISFLKSKHPYQRVYVAGVTFDTTTDKHIGFNDFIQGSYEGNKLETIKQLHMIRTVYTPDTVDSTSQIKITKFAGEDQETVINFSEPMATADILLNNKACGYDQTAWNIKVNLQPPQEGSKEYTLQLIGKKLKLVKQTIPFIMNPTGTIVTMENPLISDAKMITETGQWIADYLNACREYSYTYLHGDPSLDTNDIIHQENKYIDGLQTQIYAHELSIAGAISGKITGRKVVR